MHIFRIAAGFFLALVLLIQSIPSLQAGTDTTCRRSFSSRGWHGAYKGVQPLESCLPRNVTMDTVQQAFSQTSRMTVRKKLELLNATCINGKLRDPDDREIVFYQLKGCGIGVNAVRSWQQMALDLKRLSATKTVITLTCNPFGFPPR